MSYKTIIKVNLDNKDQYIGFDLSDRKTVNSNANITSYPTVENKTISDHLYVEPKTISLSGSFSLNGSKGINLPDGKFRLADIEDLFERIQKEGLLSKVMTISGTDEKDFRFKSRDNMALENISWTENLNSVDFNFTFKEILSMAIKDVDYDLNQNENYPALTDALEMNFSDTLLDYTKTIGVVIKGLWNVGLIDKKFWSDVISGAKVAALGGTVIVATVLIAKAILALGATTGPWGWLIVGIALIGFAIYKAIKAAIKSAKRKAFVVKAFVHYNNTTKNNAEIKRFYDYVGNINEHLAKLNDYLLVYQLQTNEQQKSTLFIDNDYYRLEFVKGTDGYYTITVTDIRDNVISQQKLVGLESINDCDNYNYIFKTTNSNYKVYAINQAIADAHAAEKEIDENNAQSDLTNFYFVVAKIDMVNYNKLLTQIIKNAMKTVA